MLTGWRLTVSKCFLIPQRYVLGIMGFLAVVNAYTMRISLSVAITEMVVKHNTTSVPSDQTCKAPSSSGGSSHAGAVTDPDKLYEWSGEMQSLILSSFYWGYIVTHMPGGILAEKFGGKHLLGLGILSTALFTLITPLIAPLGPWYMVALRVIEGLGEGTTYPALNALLAKWVPIGERAKIGTLIYAGGQIGTVVGNAVSGSLIAATKDWASVFYLFGGLGILWFIIWTLICYSDPDSHPFISDHEKNYLQKELSNVSHESKTIPWSAILTSVPLWALVAAQIGHDWGFFSMVTDLPKYMSEVLKFSVEDNGIYSSLPYIVMWLVSMFSGWLCDLLVQRNVIGITFARKFFTTIASMGPAIFIVSASYAGCDHMLVVALFTIGMGFMGTFYCGMKVNALDLAPNFAGTLMAIVNGIGAITGVIVPYLIEAITPNHSLDEWSIVFWITFGVFFVTNIIYCLYGSADEQYWNSIEVKKDPAVTAESGSGEKDKATSN